MTESLLRERGKRDAQANIAWGCTVGNFALAAATTWSAHLSDMARPLTSVPEVRIEMALAAASFLATFALGSINRRRIRAIDNQLNTAS